MNRRERRLSDETILAKKEAFKTRGNGYGLPGIKSKPATGTRPSVNPVMIPKQTGISIVSQTFPNNYMVDWNLTEWRNACDQAIKMGYPISYAALVSWCYECSPFIQSLFRDMAVAISEIPLQLIDIKGNVLDEWNKEITEKKWFKDILKECIFSNFWGFSGINFDPYTEQVYKYPMQDLDPINRYLRATTYNFFDGINFDGTANLLWFQPSTSYEAFLGWMQPIAREFIQQNLNSNNWIAAGRRLAFPLLTLGYPEASNEQDKDGNIINSYKEDAENIAANIDPSKAIVYPYTMGPDGTIQKAIEVSEEGGSGGAGNRQKIYQDFNNDSKNDIREFIFGSTLTSSVGSKGSLALGAIHYKKYQAHILYIVEEAAAMLNDNNDGFIKKLSQIYPGFPKGVSFKVNKAKQWDLEEIAILSPVLRANGKKLTDDFFVSTGLTEDDFEEAPITPATPNNNDPSGESKTLSSRLVLATEEPEKKSFNFLKKKVQS